MKVMQGWHAVAQSRELPAGKPLGLRRFGEDWVLWRDAAGTAFALKDRCPHRAAKLSLGAVTKGDLRCPYHGMAFDGRGACIFVPELGRAAPALQASAIPVREENGFLWLWIGGGAQPVGAPPWFESLAPSGVYTSQDETWPTHYARWVENELDINHLPFVHARTIGRGRDPQARSAFHFSPSGIRIRLDEDRPDKAGAEIDFRYPNLWKLSASNQMHLVMVFAPIAEDRTKIYVRTYHNFARNPALRALIEPLLRWFNNRVLAEDRRIVLSQPRLSSAGDPPETLFRQDAAVRHYRSLTSAFVDARLTPEAAPVGLVEAERATARH